MLVPEFIKTLDTNFKTTFTEKFVDEIVNAIYDSRVKVTNLNLKNQFGIYVFFCKGKHVFNSVIELEDKWYSEDIQKSPRVIQKNFDKSLKFESSYSFYVGKSEKLKSRVHEHLNHHRNHATYGLKIKDRLNFNANDFEIGYWYLESENDISKEIKQFVITTLEQKVRAKLNPLIGKK